MSRFNVERSKANKKKKKKEKERKKEPQTEIFPQISWTLIRRIHTWSGTKGNSWYRGVLFEVSLYPTCHAGRVSFFGSSRRGGKRKIEGNQRGIFSFRLHFARWRVIRRTADSRRALVATKPILGLAHSAVSPSCRGYDSNLPNDLENPS